MQYDVVARKAGDGLQLLLRRIASLVGGVGVIAALVSLATFVTGWWVFKGSAGWWVIGGLVCAVPPAAANFKENVVSSKLADGVWMLGGGSHNSVAVEMKDHAIVIEGPLYDARAALVVAETKKLIPNKPIRYVINTHVHFDHSGGLRAAVAEGLTVVTLKGNGAFFQEAMSRPHTIVPDALAKAPKPLKLEVIEKDTELKDAAMTVNLFTIDGSSHSDTMLMAYFPKDRLLVEADVYSPAAAVHPFAANLLENVTKRKLKVDRIVPIHGGVVPFGDLVKVVAPAN